RLRAAAHLARHHDAGPRWLHDVRPPARRRPPGALPYRPAQRRWVSRSGPRQRRRRHRLPRQAISDPPAQRAPARLFGGRARGGMVSDTFDEAIARAMAAYGRQLLIEADEIEAHLEPLSTDDAARRSELKRAAHRLAGTAG